MEIFIKNPDNLNLPEALAYRSQDLDITYKLVQPKVNPDYTVTFQEYEPKPILGYILNPDLDPEKGGVIYGIVSESPSRPITNFRTSISDNNIIQFYTEDFRRTEATEVHITIKLKK